MHFVIVGLLVATQPSASPEFVVHTQRGTLPPGRIQSVGTDLSVQYQSGSGPENGVAAGQLLSLRRVDLALPAWPSGQQVILTNGDRITGRCLGGDARVLSFELSLPAGTDTPPPWVIPLTSVAAVWVTPPPGEQPVDPARYAWMPKRGDAVLSDNGDTLAGNLEAFTASPPGVRIRSTGQPATTVALKSVKAIALDPTLTKARKLAGTSVRVVLIDGTRITLAQVRVTGGSLTGTTAYGGVLQIPIDRVVMLDVLGDRAVWLADLKPVEVEAVGFTGEASPWRSNRSATGAALCIHEPAGVSTYDTGFGVSARTRLTFDVPPGATHFEATIGLDASQGRQGSALVQVVVDGNVEAKTATTLQGGSEPWRVRVPLEGVKRISLATDFGPTGGAFAAVNWCDAKMIVGERR